jgi:hypothetical protein
MTTSGRGASHWSSTSGGAATLTAPEAWHATRAQTSLATQIQRDKNEYLSQEPAEIGRVTGPNERELFVSCDVAPALQQQFEAAHADFIVVHDIGTTSSRKLLKGLAAASGRSLQKLAIRRQGYGQALATLFFLELPASNGTVLRMYTTQAETDAATRKGVARMLLAFSRLGVLMVGNVSPMVLQPELDALRADVAAGPWHNRHLLLLPLASASNLIGHGTELAHRSGLNVRTTPVVSRPAEAWGYISDTWKRLSDSEPPAASAARDVAPVPELAVERPSQSLPWTGSTFSATSSSGFPSVAPSTYGHDQEPPPRPSAAPRSARMGSPDSPEPKAAAESATPALSRSAPSFPARAAEIRASAPTVRMALAEPPAAHPELVPTLSLSASAGEHGMLQRYVRLLSALNGMRSCCVFNVASGARLAHSGNSHSATELGRQGQKLLEAMSAASQTLGSGDAMPEAAITLGAHHLLLRAIPKHPQAALHAVFDKATTNLTLARLQVLRLDALFEDAPRGA